MVCCIEQKEGLSTKVSVDSELEIFLGFVVNAFHFLPMSTPLFSIPATVSALCAHHKRSSEGALINSN